MANFMGSSLITCLAHGSAALFTSAVQARRLSCRSVERAEWKSALAVATHRFSIRISTGSFDAHPHVQQFVVPLTWADDKRRVVRACPISVMDNGAKRQWLSDGAFGPKPMDVDELAIASHVSISAGDELAPRMAENKALRSDSSNIMVFLAVATGNICWLSTAALADAYRHICHASKRNTANGLIR